MKGMLRKALAGVAAAALAVTGLAVGASSASADSTTSATISVSGATDGSTYTAYKIASFENVEGSNGAVSSADVVTEQAAVVAVRNAINAIEDEDVSLPGVYASNPAAWLATQSDSVLRQFAEEFSAEGLDYTARATANSDGNVSLLVTEGWYVVVNDDGRAIVVATRLTEGDDTYTTWDGDTLGVAVAKPDTVPVPGKDANVSGPVGVGDQVPYTIEITVPNWAGYDTYTYTVTDTPGTGLTLPAVNDGTDPEYYTVKNGDTTLTYGEDYTMAAGANGSVVFTFDMTKFTVGSTITIDYTATVTNDAVNTVTNTVNVKDQQLDSSSETTETVPLGGFTFEKTNVNGKDLTGAKFSVYAADEKGDKTGGPLSFVSTSNGSYRLAGDGDTGTTMVLVNASGNVFSVTGLAAGTYVVEEVSAPNGYADYGLSFNVTVAFDDNGDATFKLVSETSDLVLGDLGLVDQDKAGDMITVKNVKSITQLPQTGAAGIALFVVLGLLIAGAGVTVWMKSRNMRNAAING